MLGSEIDQVLHLLSLISVTVSSCRPFRFWQKNRFNSTNSSSGFHFIVIFFISVLPFRPDTISISVVVDFDDNQPAIVVPSLLLVGRIDIAKPDGSVGRTTTPGKAVNSVIESLIE